MQYSTSIGLDVHARTVCASALVHETGEIVRASFGADPTAIAAWAASLPQPARAVYESGPTGFALKRSLDALGLPTVVGAVTKMLRPSGDRVKTDRRDADFLARMLAVGNVVECWCPAPAQEADRDLSRLREQVREDLMRARHQLSKFLPGKGLVFGGRTTWGAEHRRWLDSVELAEPEERFVYGELRAQVAALEERRRRVDAEIARRSSDPALSPVVSALSGIRGISTLTAFSVAVECGDLSRFRSARAFMSFVGLVPSESSSGESVSRGGITKAGNSHVRRLLVEAAWHQERPLGPARAEAMAASAPDARLAQACSRCNLRLHGRFLALRRRGKPGPVCAAAVARELAGFVWAMGRDAQALAAAAS
ncbi:MAG: IS110 family transposase [Olsenella sp.]|jgi:transposase|nr:IS110 family transposase [Olsenella sp.]MCI1289519.1 IS110 family transposase [Olsenella sp.]